MKITVVCDVLGVENNGTTISAMNLIRAMAKRGHEVTVVCSDEDKRGKDGYVVMPTLSLGPLNNYVRKTAFRFRARTKGCLSPLSKTATSFM